MRRAVIGEFLTFIRKDRRGQSLSNGALKLHHQTLKTLFNYDRSSTLWLTRSGDPLTKAGLRQMMLTISRIKKSVADGVYTHQFRHTVVPRLLKAESLSDLSRYTPVTQTCIRHCDMLRQLTSMKLSQASTIW